MPLALVNGEKQEYISVSNRGLSYGDGVFTTVKITNQSLQLWDFHKDRLVRDCKKLGLTFDLPALECEATKLCADVTNSSVLKIILIRHGNRRGYRPLTTDTVRILQITDFDPYPPEYAQQGVNLTVCRLRLSDTPALAGVKHLNRLEQVLARAEWGDEYQEGLMLDAKGHVIEGTMSNLFIVQNNKLLTPELNRCGVSGVMREHIIANVANAKLDISETKLTLEDLYRADGIFLCNTLIGAWPVARIDQKHCFSSEFMLGYFNKILEIVKRSSQ